MLRSCDRVGYVEKNNIISPNRHSSHRDSNLRPLTRILYYFRQHVINAAFQDTSSHVTVRTQSVQTDRRGLTSRTQDRLLKAEDTQNERGGLLVPGRGGVGSAEHGQPFSVQTKSLESLNPIRGSFSYTTCS